MCFPADSIVITPFGTKPLRDVEAGDTVRVVTPTGQAIWSQVCGWLHRDPKQPTAYLRLTTSRRQVVVAPTHLIAVVRDDGIGIEFERAETAQVGTRLLESETHLTQASVWGNQVVKVENITAEGAFAPLTMSGTIFVDAVAASCYAETTTHTGAHVVMKPMRHRWRRKPGKMAQPGAKESKHVPGSHRYVDLLAHMAGRAEK